MNVRASILKSLSLLRNFVTNKPRDEKALSASTKVLGMPRRAIYNLFNVSGRLDPVHFTLDQIILFRRFPE